MPAIAGSWGPVMREEPFFRRQLQPGVRLTDRDSALVRMCQGKSVVHVGCVDHPLAEEKLASGTLLHAKILAVSDRVVGIDIDEQGLQALREAIGGEYLCVDLSDIGAAAAPDARDLFGFEPDVYVVGDVIEHLHDPIALLSGIASIERRSHAAIVVSTPNSLAARNVLNTALGFELMHPDHLLIHSPTTLKRTVEAAGLRINEWGYYSIQTGTDLTHRLYDGACRIASRLRPAWGDGLVISCASNLGRQPQTRSAGASALKDH